MEWEAKTVIAYDTSLSLIIFLPHPCFSVISISKYSFYNHQSIIFSSNTMTKSITSIIKFWNKNCPSLLFFTQVVISYILFSSLSKENLTNFQAYVNFEISRFSLFSTLKCHCFLSIFSNVMCDTNITAYYLNVIYQINKSSELIWILWYFSLSSLTIISYFYYPHCSSQIWVIKWVVWNSSMDSMV